MAVAADSEVEEEAVEALAVEEGEVVVVLEAVGVEVEDLVVAVLEGEEEGDDSVPIMIIIIMIMLGNVSIIFLHEVILITLFFTFFIFLAI